MPETVILRAPAKINLNLYITGTRPDGYHELDTLFLKLENPTDELRITPLPTGAGLELLCDIPGLPTESNIIYKAWQAFAQRTGHRPDLRVEVAKRIPMGAGLGGGSTDAAALLAHLNAGAGRQALSHAELIALAATLGADVPFFLHPEPAARAKGIGERLAPAEVRLQGLCLVLACPDEHVDTAWAYRQWDRCHHEQSFLTSEESDTKSAGPENTLVLHNDFEPVVFREFPRLREIKQRLLASGACGAAMSGSGAGIFAFFRQREAAETAVLFLRAEGVSTYFHQY
ncbi:MAG: 4-(cytidine 5'-diphospho)-2-C-methyl-D-erythritol kinase [Desulfovibrionaceae bacterium]